MHLLTLWPWPLTFKPPNHITSRISQGHFIYRIWTLRDHSVMYYAADKQTNRQTDGVARPTHPNNTVAVGNQLELTFKWYAASRVVSPLLVSGSAITVVTKEMSRASNSSGHQEMDGVLKWTAWPEGDCGRPQWSTGNPGDFAMMSYCRRRWQENDRWRQTQTQIYWPLTTD